MTNIAKCDRNLLQSVTGITKCDKKLLQNVTSNTMWDDYYKVTSWNTTQIPKNI